MNSTTDNSTLLSCGVAFLPITPTDISPDLRVVLNVRLAVNAITCPFIILLNVLHFGDGGSENQTTASHQV